MRADGSGVRQLTDNDASDEFPAWQQTGEPDAGSLTQRDWRTWPRAARYAKCWAKSTLLFTAPAVDADTALTFRAAATDSGGNAANTTVTVWVLDGNGADNTAPTAIIPPTSQATETPATLAVTAPAGANVGLIVNGAPAPGATTVNNGDTLQLAATAGTTPGDTVTVGVTIGGVSADWVMTTGVRPTACAGDELTGAPGDEVTLQGTCSINPYGAWYQMEHQWTQLSGPPVTLTHPQIFQPASKFGDPRLIIPTDADAGTTLEFELTVTDQNDKSDSDTMTVTVIRPDNTPPVVAELAPLRVFAGATVRLAGQATDAEDAADAADLPLGADRRNANGHPGGSQQQRPELHRAGGQRRNGADLPADRNRLRRPHRQPENDGDRTADAHGLRRGRPDVHGRGLR